MGVSLFERPIGHLRAHKSPIGGLHLSLSACRDLGVSLFERPIGHLRACEPGGSALALMQITVGAGVTLLWVIKGCMVTPIGCPPLGPWDMNYNHPDLLSTSLRTP